MRRVAGIAAGRGAPPRGLFGLRRVVLLRRAHHHGIVQFLRAGRAHHHRARGPHHRLVRLRRRLRVRHPHGAARLRRPRRADHQHRRHPPPRRRPRRAHRHPLHEPRRSRRICRRAGPLVLAAPATSATSSTSWASTLAAWARAPRSIATPTSSTSTTPTPPSTATKTAPRPSRRSEDFVAECEENYGDLLPFLGTTDVARDMDEVRKALGDEQINYLGYSYGTSLGQEYARLFPTKVRTMILDGVVDHDARRPRDGRKARPAASRPPRLVPGQLRRRRLRLRQPERQRRHRRGGRQGRGGAHPGRRRRPPGHRRAWCRSPWPRRSTARRCGVASPERCEMPKRATAPAWSSWPTCTWAATARGTTTAPSRSTSPCRASTRPGRPTPTRPSNASIEAEAETPYFGGPIVLDYIRCSLWPTPAKPLAPVPADTEGLPPVLVVSTTKDPATPYENGVAVAEQIPGAVLVTNEGEGHTIVGQGKPCIDDLGRATTSSTSPSPRAASPASRRTPSYHRPMAKPGVSRVSRVGVAMAVLLATASVLFTPTAASACSFIGPMITIEDQPSAGGTLVVRRHRILRDRRRRRRRLLRRLHVRPDGRRHGHHQLRHVVGAVVHKP